MHVASLASRPFDKKIIENGAILTVSEAMAMLRNCHFRATFLLGYSSHSRPIALDALNTRGPGERMGGTHIAPR